MKKIITFCAFALIMILGVQNITAQNKIEINEMASTQTKSLRKAIKFNNDQRDKVYEALKFYHTNTSSLNESTFNTTEQKKKLDDILDLKMKEILNEEQYEVYKNLNQ
jgi:hypothetical protein